MTPPRPPRRTRVLACVASTVALVASVVAVVVAPDASGDRDRRVDTARLAAKRAAGAKLERTIAAAPAARRDGRCTAPEHVAGVGLACRTSGGMLVLPARAGEAPRLTHGPDLVDATPGSAAADGGFGTPDSIACSAPSASRHVVLVYLLPSDFASGTAGVHGDRSAEVVPQLRQALLDAATMVDRRAGELAPGSRRRIRAACGTDGLPIVERIVLPRTAAFYRDAPDGGFTAIESDLDDLGLIPDYDDFSLRRTASVRRLLAYYDADYDLGVAGQGVMFRRTAMLAQGARANDPLISRTVRNINNNPPNGSFAVQYGTAYDGVPDPPLYTSLLHELAHTMGAVQDEPGTSSDAGHCLDGLDIMCYDDGGPGGSYTGTACPDPTPATFEAADERFDCNGDTYFHPAPPAGHPLADARTWHLGLPANETFLAVGTFAPPAAVTRVAANGRGTSIAIRWPAVAGARGYDVAFRASGGAWDSIGIAASARPVAVPPLRARTDYEFVVRARDSRGLVGGAATTTRRTAADTSAPGAPGRPFARSAARTSVQLRFDAARDNERVTRYVVEQRSGTRWSLLASFPAPVDAGGVVTSPRITRLRSGTAYTIRLRALDARGNRSAPSATGVATTR